MKAELLRFGMQRKAKRQCYWRLTGGVLACDLRRSRDHEESAPSKSTRETVRHWLSSRWGHRPPFDTGRSKPSLNTHRRFVHKVQSSFEMQGTTLELSCSRALQNWIYPACALSR